MNENKNPKTHREEEKFNPENVADESAGNPSSSGRAERNMDDTPRGSEGDRRRSAQNR